MSILAKSKQTSPDQSFWVKDEYVLSCTSCDTKFSITVRRHHCRACGEVFCNSCTSKSLSLPHLGYPVTQKLRVCETCYTKLSLKDTDPHSSLNSDDPNSSELSESLIRKETLEGVKRIYKSSIKQLERQFKFGSFYSPLLSDADFESKPMVLLLGQYSVGKTSFIKYLIGRDFPGARIGPEPTTDQFVVVSGSKQGDTIIPGNALAVQTDKPFQSLSQFGASFLNKFQCSETDIRSTNTILENITFVDTPGVLSGEKQRIGRSYDFTGVIEWFAGRCDRILLLFDAHKLDISDEFQAAIRALKGHDDKVRVVLNKSDMVDSQQLMRVHGALMWSLGKVITTPEVIRVYVGSFWDNPLRYSELADLFKKEANDLLSDLKSLPYSAVIRKTNEIVKRARAAKIHALIVNHLQQKVPYFSKDSAVLRMLENLDNEFAEISRKHGIPLGDFPLKEDFTKTLSQVCNNDLSIFPPLNNKMIVELDDVLSASIPRLQAQHSKKMMQYGYTNLSTSFSENMDSWNGISNLYETALVAKSEARDVTGKPVPWELSKDDFARYAQEFQDLKPIGGRLSGLSLKESLEASGLPRHSLKKIWDLSDIDEDGSLDILEFSVAKYLIETVQASENFDDIPDVLPKSLVPPTKRHLFYRD